MQTAPQTIPPVRPPARHAHRGFWFAIIMLMFFLGLSAVVNLGLLIGLVAAVSGGPFHRTGGGFRGNGEDEYPRVKEIWSCGAGDVKVVRLVIEGLIAHERVSSFFRPEFDKIEAIQRQIRAARNDPDVRGIIVEMDSPGGGLTASDEIYNELDAFRRSDESRRVVIHVKDLAASGGYYVAMASDWIIAEPTAIIGSIGVMIQTLNWKGLSEKIGLTDVTIKAGRNKDLLNPFHDVPTNQLAQLQTMIDVMHARFLALVKNNRALDEDTLREIGDGRILSADEALRVKLIDQIGYWEDAVAKTAGLLGETSIKVVRYEERPSFSQLFSQISTPMAFDLTKLIESDTPRLLYLWKP